ncbi:MAG: ATP-binding protein [Fuerstiella sp.]|nr:ATP-binding protein [Fuerstiella sp.]
MTQERSTNRARGLSVSAKISLGFSIVLALHVSIAVLGHYGLSKSRADLEEYDTFNHQVEAFDAIDRVVGALQRNVLLFAFSGYHGPEARAAQLHDELDELLVGASMHPLTDSDRAAIETMKSHLTAHRAMFDAVVVDRAKRRRLVDQVLERYSREFFAGMDLISRASAVSGYVSAIEAEFRAAELSAMYFVHAPDSTHVRNSKAHLAAARQLLNNFDSDDEDDSVAPAETTMAAVNGYEDTLIQMVEATRGYLHLVNFVLAGESEEFRRLAGEIRSKQSQHVNSLATTMASDSHRFQLASNAFSILTIVLGIAAAWVIGSDVAPPLNAIARTFDELACGQARDRTPGLARSDELGRLATAAQVFKERAAETESLLEDSEAHHLELNELNERLKTQTEVARSKADEATSATMAKSEFLANMSHEIRTPMTEILGFTDILIDNVVEKKNMDSARTIKENGKYLLEHINDILDLSKIESGKIEVDRIESSPHQILADVVTLMTVRAKAKGLSLGLQLNGPIPETIGVDPNRLRQILINLVGNSIKFTETGAVRIDARLMTSFEDGPKLRFDVTDSGIGIANEKIEGIFKPFTQADGSTTRRFGGTGLGLSISRRLAELLGGEFSVSSTLGEGSTFSFTVSTGPLNSVRLLHATPAPSESTTTEEILTETDGSIFGDRVLLAEDRPDNQRLISFILRKAGAEVIVAGNGQHAVDMAKAATRDGCPFDVILMDMQMPVLDGYAATRQLSAEGYTLPIVALTAHAMSTDRAKSLEAGCDDYATKPVDKRRLIDTVARHSRRRTSVGVE